MSINFTEAPLQRLSRNIIVAFAVVLACLATWILAAEYFRSPVRGFPADAQSAMAIAANRNNAAKAASIGLLRGDLWSEYALTYVDLLQHEKLDNGNPEAAKVQAQALQTIDRALSLAPNDSLIWLVLAGLDARSENPRHAPGAALRMSYYTGPNEDQIIPFRLRLAVRSRAFAERDFQDLVRHDVQTIVTQRPEMKPAILAAYKEASPASQQFIEKTLKDIDPNLLTMLSQK